MYSSQQIIALLMFHHRIIDDGYEIEHEENGDWFIRPLFALSGYGPFHSLKEMIDYYDNNINKR